MLPKRTMFSRDDGGVAPVVIAAIMVVFISAVYILHIGRAGDLRTQAQTAADAAALGGVAEIRDRALQSIVTGVLPYAVYNQTTTDAAVKRYAQENGATATKIESGGFLGNYVAADVRGNQSLRGFIDKIRGKRANANAIATVEFPSCFPRYVTDDDGDSHLIGTVCDGRFVPLGADPSPFIDLFELRLVDELPANCFLPGASGDTYWPVQNITPSSHFGPRDGDFHGGTDYPGGGDNAPIFAYADGIVVRAGAASGYGQWIVIDHNIEGQKVSTLYGHMYPDDLLVKVGDRVRGGQQIARIGNNGNSRGAHLHFEYYPGGRFSGGEGVDPHPYVQAAKPPRGGGAPVDPEALALGAPLVGCGPLGPGGPVSGNPGDLKLCASAAKSAGFTGEALVLITAIGRAESGCRPDATNTNTNGSTDIGLFQINNSAHPQYDPQSLLDPVTNARAAYKISGGGTNFYPWCTYLPPSCGGNGNSTYAQYIPAAQQAVADLEK